VGKNMEYIGYRGISNNFLNRNPIAQQLRERDYMKLKSLYRAKESSPD
jgi:hypothetical protein